MQTLTGTSYAHACARARTHTLQNKVEHKGGNQNVDPGHPCIPMPTNTIVIITIIRKLLARPLAFLSIALTRLFLVWLVTLQFAFSQQLFS